MKITKTRLKQIIKEELEAALLEQDFPDMDDAFGEMDRQIAKSEEEDRRRAAARAAARKAAPKRQQASPPVSDSPAPRSREKVRTSVTKGTLRNARISNYRREGKFIIATATNEDGVSAEGKGRYRGSLSLARSSAAAAARANLLRKLQEK